jgi:hypothetical protein
VAERDHIGSRRTGPGHVASETEVDDEVETVDGIEEVEVIPLLEVFPLGRAGLRQMRAVDDPE